MLRSLVLPLGLLGLSLFSAAPARAQEPVQTLVITDDLPPPSARTNTLLLGTAFFGGAYGLTVAASYGWADDPGAADLRIPLVGPWIKLGQTTLCNDLPDPVPGKTCSDPVQVVGGVLAVVSGLAQFAGLVLIGEGVFMRTRRPAAQTALLQPTDRLRLRAPNARVDWRRPHAVDVSVAPVFTTSTFGAVVSGTF
jgi:hypothetical protein